MPRGRPRKNADQTKKNNGANLGFEAKLWAAANKLGGNMEPSDYKHVASGLVFLKNGPLGKASVR
jgi:type I restriction enzyme M protein